MLFNRKHSQKIALPSYKAEQFMNTNYFSLKKKYNMSEGKIKWLDLNNRPVATWQNNTLIIKD